MAAIPPEFWEWQRSSGNYSTGSFQVWSQTVEWAEKQKKMAASTNATGDSGPQLNVIIQQPWHTFPCGHQLKLEHGQPTPTLCEKCGPVEYETYTYAKCGHAL